MSATPETDAAVIASGGDWSPVLRAVSQRLERERDEAREDLEFRRGLYKLQEEYLEDARRERDEAREALADWENAAAHVEADHPDEKHCGCVPVLRKLLADSKRERDEARELCRELADLVAYGLGQSGEPWSLDAMRQAADAIQKAKQMGTLPTD